MLYATFKTQDRPDHPAERIIFRSIEHDTSGGCEKDGVFMRALVKI